MCVVLTVCLVAQLASPRLLALMQRDAVRIDSGEPFRIVTALFFQDGWIAGGVSNIAWLAVMGTALERVVGPRRWLAIYGLAGVTAELVALRWQPVGAGNSVAVFGLAGCLVALAARPRAVPATLLPIISICAAVFLLVARDVHGAAYAIGMICGIVLR